MALKAIMLKKKIDDKKKELEALRGKDEEFTQREADLETSIEEAETDEEKTAVEEEVDKFDEEKKLHDEAKSNLEGEVNDLEAELKGIETEDQARSEKIPEERKAEKMVVEGNKTERKHGYDMIMEREDVKAWISEIRAHIKEKRELTNVGLTIPEVFLGLLRENVDRYSKLYRHVTIRPVNGTAREAVMGSVPEGVWTECCANLNELSVVFNDV